MATETLKGEPPKYGDFIGYAAQEMVAHYWGAISSGHDALSATKNPQPSLPVQFHCEYRPGCFSFQIHNLQSL